MIVRQQDMKGITKSIQGCVFDDFYFGWRAGWCHDGHHKNYPGVCAPIYWTGVMVEGQKVKGTILTIMCHTQTFQGVALYFMARAHCPFNSTITYRINLSFMLVWLRNSVWLYTFTISVRSFVLSTWEGIGYIMRMSNKLKMLVFQFTIIDRILFIIFVSFGFKDRLI